VLSPLPLPLPLSPLRAAAGLAGASASLLAPSPAGVAAPAAIMSSWNDDKNWSTSAVTSVCGSEVAPSPAAEAADGSAAADSACCRLAA